MRCFVSLEEEDPQKKLYFAQFSDKLRLSKVIVGAHSRVTRDELRAALGDAGSNVVTIKAQLAFKTFRVVSQPNPRLWV